MKATFIGSGFDDVGGVMCEIPDTHAGMVLKRILRGGIKHVVKGRYVEYGLESTDPSYLVVGVKFPVPSTIDTYNIDRVFFNCTFLCKPFEASIYHRLKMSPKFDFYLKIGKNTYSEYYIQSSTIIF